MKTRFLQIIFILISLNSIGQNPIFTPSTKKNDTISQYPTDCGPDPLYMQAKAYSFCTKSPKLRYSYQVDFGNDGKFDLRGTGSKLILTKANGLKYGRHFIKWKVTDECGKSTEINKIFLVKDAKKPTPVAKLLSIEILDPQIQGKLEAIKVNNFSWDNCTPMANLRFRLAKAGEYTHNMTLSDVLALNDYVEFNPCEDKGTQTIALFAIDADNNWDYVETFVVVQSNINCDSLLGLKMTTGKITYTNDVAISSVNIIVDNKPQTSTNNSGIYKVKFNKRLTEISPFYFIAGYINSADLVALDKHLKQIDTIKSPYKKIAADANNDHKIDLIDYEIIRNIILFTNDTSNIRNKYTFVPKGYIFTTDTFNYPTTIVYDSILKNNIDFYGIKIGAVSSTNFSESYDRAAIPKLPLVLKNQHFTKDEEVRVSLQMPECEAYSYTFQFDPSQLSLLRIEGLDEKSYNLQRASDGIITVLFVNGYSIGDKPNFIFRANC
ncbi:MAG: hypothetical protein IPL95_19800 [Saprospiraceae bacterium]|nr:hypothetical protein [Saprospiraceae bacterium]